MNPIHRIRRSLARLAVPAGAAKRRASMLPGPAAGRPGRDGVAGRFSQDVARPRAWRLAISRSLAAIPAGGLALGQVA